MSDIHYGCTAMKESSPLPRAPFESVTVYESGRTRVCQKPWITLTDITDSTSRQAPKNVVGVDELTEHNFQEGGRTLFTARVKYIKRLISIRPGKRERDAVVESG